MSRYELDIMPLKRRFWMAAVIFLVMAMAGVSQSRSRRLLEKTHDELVRAKAGLTRVKEAKENRKKALEILNTEYMLGVTNISDERLLYGKMDDLKARLRPDDLIVAAIERKGGEVSLPFTLKFINPNYNDFLNTISFLEGTVFPFTVVNTVAITQAESGGKGVVSFIVNAKVLTSAKSRP